MEFTKHYIIKILIYLKKINKNWLLLDLKLYFAKKIKKKEKKNETDKRNYFIFNVNSISSIWKPRFKKF